MGTRWSWDKASRPVQIVNLEIQVSGERLGDHHRVDVNSDHLAT
ncbi:hypothetical protein PoMZ_02173 [Pyricularia oryzae]|uniref:Uncharacterized protein n=1 Tax=Pyricularia oryzae TaxID=318829 RepID=A0A4P7N457_PYROR|nr:hypothetical protein PoMZ_02173 [Pyricularia oryzae]